MDGGDVIKFDGRKGFASIEIEMERYVGECNFF
jgi:hypothetical protein